MAGIERTGNDFVDFQYLIVADSLNHAIRRVETVTGLVSTVFGTLGVEGSTSTLLRRPGAVALSVDGGWMFIADTGNHIIRLCCSDLETGQPGAPTIAGVSGQAGYAEGFPGLFNKPGGLAIGEITLGVGFVLVADTGNSVIRRITIANDFSSSSGLAFTTSLVAGIPGQPGFADSAVGATAKFNHPTGLAYDPGTHKLYVADTGNHVVRVVDMAPGANAAVATFAGSPGQYGHRDGLRTAEALFAQPVSVSIDGNTLLVSDRASYTVRRIENDPTLMAPKVTTVAGVAWERGFADGTAATARLRAPSGAVSLGGRIYVADTGNNMLRAIRQDGQGVFVSTLTGDRLAGTSDGWPATFTIGSPTTIACDGARLYIDGAGVQAIDLNPDGTSGAARTVASSDWTGFVYAPGMLYRPMVYSAEALELQTGNHGQITTVEDTDKDENFNVLTVGPDVFAEFMSWARGKAVLAKVTGNFEVFEDIGVSKASVGIGTFIYTASENQISRLDVSTRPIASTIIPVPGLSGVSAMTVAGGAAYVTGVGRHDVRKVDLATGTVTTLAGSVQSAGAPFTNPGGLCVTGGNLFVADTGNGVIRRVNVATGATVTVAIQRAQ